jgi:hypothetical protein
MTSRRTDPPRPTSLREIDHVRDLLDRLRVDVPARSVGAVIVEGPSDQTILSRALQTPGVSFFPVGGRRNVLRASEALSERCLRGVVCVADTDFDDEAVGRAGTWFLVFTDNADLLAMAFVSPAFDRFVAEWASESKLEMVGGLQALRDLIRAALELVSKLRRGNALTGAGVDFGAVDLAELVEKSTLAMAEAKLLTRLAAASRLPKSDLDGLAKNDAPSCRHTGEMLLRGHDYAAVAATSLRKLVASLSAQQVKPPFVENSMRLTVRADDFHGTPFLERLETALTRALAEPEL